MSNFERAQFGDPGVSFGGKIELSDSERSLILERNSIQITPEVLLSDNQHPDTQESIDAWRNIRESHALVVVDKCSDARSFEDKPEGKVILPSIAASGPIEPFERVYQDPKVKAIMTLSHYSSLQEKIGENPSGCGGRAGKAAQKNGSGPIEGDTNLFIRQHVPHEDVVVNSVLRALKLTRITGKPVLAGAQDHITGRIKPLAWFHTNERGKHTGESEIPLDFLVEGGYDPKKIYEQGVPSLPIEALPDDLAQLIIDNQIHVAALEQSFPDFHTSQEVQNPKTLLLSTSTKPARIRYPRTFGFPGTFFSLRFGRERIDGGDIVNPESLHEGLRQAHFAIYNSVKNHGNDAEQFSRTNTVLIETSSLDRSFDLAVELAEKDWMKDWMGLEGHQILLARTRAGITDRVERLT